MMPPFLAALTPYKLLFECLAFLALIAAIAFAFHSFVTHQQQIGYDRRVAEDNAQALKDQEAARKVEALWTKQLETAQNENTVQNQRITALASALATTSSGVRSLSGNIISNLSSASAETARKTAAAFAGVFQDCTGKYASMAEIADRHVADIRLYKSTWPEYKAPEVTPAQ